MANEALQQLVRRGLQAAKAGGMIAERATSEIQNDAGDSDLKAALQLGNQQSQKWMERIQQAISESGSAEDTGNPILEAHYEVSKKIRGKAQDEMSRDLGIIAAGQLALHYWIATFGTLRSYASQLGLTQTAQVMETSVNEASQADEKHTQIAEKIMAGNEAMAGTR